MSRLLRKKRDKITACSSASYKNKSATILLQDVSPNSALCQENVVDSMEYYDLMFKGQTFIYRFNANLIQVKLKGDSMRRKNQPLSTIEL